MRRLHGYGGLGARALSAFSSRWCCRRHRLTCVSVYEYAIYSIYCVLHVISIHTHICIQHKTLYGSLLLGLRAYIFFPSISLPPRRNGRPYIFRLPFSPYCSICIPSICIILYIHNKSDSWLIFVLTKWWNAVHWKTGYNQSTVNIGTLCCCM